MDHIPTKQAPAVKMSFFMRVLRGDATKDQAKDTGMAIVLLLLLVFTARRRDGYIALAIVAHLVTMIAPQVYRPLAVLWFGLSHVMGTVASKIILTVVFFVVVTPIALW